MASPTPQEVRKTVTIVFSDLNGSTNLGEALDTEALREVLSRYFAGGSGTRLRAPGRARPHTRRGLRA